VKRFGTHAHALVYRLSRGRILGRLGGQSVLLLQTVGRRTGQTHTTPVQYLPSDGAFVVVAANAGAPRPPAWYLNLCAAPNAAVRIGTKDIDVHAREVHDAERDAMWAELTAANRYLERVARKAGRVLPVLVLAPIESPQTADRTVAPAPAGVG
jgi:deazaflavin-dependent oxidoreductase (nitroreductase family)